MPTLDPRIDAYIANSADFAQPILAHLRAVVHEACPEAEETIKWSMPFFLYQGMLCNMAAFKAHCAFGFWKGELLAQEGGKAREAMGQFGRISSLEDLPPKKTLIGYVRKAMALNAEGVRAPARARPKAARDVAVPDYLSAALEGKPGASAHFQAFSPSARREYVDWLQDARTEATRLRRLEQALDWIAEGKQRNWKYMNC